MNMFAALQPQAKEAWGLFVIFTRLGFDPRQVAMGQHENGQLILSLVGNENKIYTAFLGPPFTHVEYLLAQWKEACIATFEKTTRSALINEELERTQAYASIHEILARLAENGMLDLKKLVLEQVDLQQIQLPTEDEQSALDVTDIQIEVEKPGDESQTSKESGNGDDSRLLGRKD